MGGEGGGEGIPADVAGEVLAAGAGEQIGDLGVAVIGAAGAGGGAGGELSPGFTVVAGDEKAVPWGGGEFGGELLVQRFQLHVFDASGGNLEFAWVIGQ